MSHKCISLSVRTHFISMMVKGRKRGKEGGKKRKNAAPLTGWPGQFVANLMQVLHLVGVSKNV